MTFRPPDTAPCRTRDPELWFRAGQGQQTAVGMCHGCPALDPCRAQTLADDAAAVGEPYGVSGGMTQFQRRKARRARDQANVAEVTAQ